MLRINVDMVNYRESLLLTNVHKSFSDSLVDRDEVSLSKTIGGYLKQHSMISCDDFFDVRIRLAGKLALLREWSWGG